MVIPKQKEMNESSKHATHKSYNMIYHHIDTFSSVENLKPSKLLY